MPGGFITSTTLGVVGSLLGGYYATQLGFAGISDFDWRSLFIAFLGSLFVLAPYVYRSRSSLASSIQSSPLPQTTTLDDLVFRVPEQDQDLVAKQRNQPRQLVVFMSYRRVDSSDVTGRLYDRLVTHFGRDNVFKDVDSIPLGVDYRRHIDRMVSSCSVLLVVIGKQWLALAGGGPELRLQNPNDYVRIEIETALRRDIPVIPVLVQEAALPSEEELPPSLKELVYRNSINIRSDPDFHKDVDRLIASLEVHMRE